MVERGEDLRFTTEPRQPLGIIREGGRQDLERHFPSELRVLGAIDLPHAARAELREDLIGTEA